MPEPEAFARLDDLITAVRHLADEPLGQLAEASRMKEELDERADALLGHFVDQAGASRPYSSATRSRRPTDSPSVRRTLCGTRRRWR